VKAYYNEIDPNAAAWLRELIKRGLIAPGVVDDRSIEDITPAELAGFSQCHFFAGIAGWSYALRLAGWPDDRPVWTGSCPCQPFSVAGAGQGFADERHLWPAWFHLIDVCRPRTIFGEQVASRDALAWLDTVQSDLEGAGYAVGALDLCAAGFGAPHIRQRLYFVADAGYQPGRSEQRYQPREELGRPPSPPDGVRPRECGIPRLLADRSGRGCRERGDATLPRGGGHTDGGVAPVIVADSTDSNGRRGERGAEEGTGEGEQRRRGSTSGGGIVGHALIAGLEGLGRPGGGMGQPGRDDAGAARPSPAPGPVNGHWGGAEWIPCRDGRSRPVEPGSPPLAHGIPARVVRLRGYGNGIVAPQAEAFIRAAMEVLG
jgi:DNA (cytosine-5)-methyltransferase 1